MTYVNDNTAASAHKASLGQTPKDILRLPT